MSQKKINDIKSNMISQAICTKIMSVFLTPKKHICECKKILKKMANFFLHKKCALRIVSNILKGNAILATSCLIGILEWEKKNFKHTWKKLSIYCSKFKWLQ